MRKMRAMKSVWMVVVGAAALAGPETSAQGQAPVIASFGRNGELVCTNLIPGTVASVEWAASVTGPWTNSWAALAAVTADSNGAIRASVPMFYRVRGYAVPTNMVAIPAGTFAMGSPTNEPARWLEETQHMVTLTKSFCIGKYEVTQAEYLAVMGNNPSHFQGSNQPVEMVSWHDATNYCAQLTARERSAGRLPAGYGYRLPTEAEWEYACRAGTATPFHYGNELRSGMANFDGRFENPPCEGSYFFCWNPSGVLLARTTEVGSYAPNAWGLYDMHGNIWEWCQDWYVASNYPDGSVTDPQGADTGTYRALRGGCLAFGAHVCRSAARFGDKPAEPFQYYGFRVVLAPGQP